MLESRTIRCQSLDKTFDGVVALDEVSIAFPRAGIVAIIGPNGAGKTTLVNVLTGFLRPDAGKCYIADHESTHLPPHLIARSGIARTFQDLRLIAQASALDNVMLARPEQRGETLLGALFRIGVRRQEAPS